MNEERPKFSLKRGLKRAVPVFVVTIVAIFGGEALRENGAPPPYVDAGLIFVGVLVARWVAWVK